MKKEFHIAFQLSKLIIFEVEYYTLGNNKYAYFSTSAEMFYQNKRGLSRFGQCQDDLLADYPDAMSFYKKWDVHHCKDLSEEAFTEMVNDLVPLTAKYNYLIKEHIKSETISCDFSFNALKELSMMTPKSSLKTAKAQIRHPEPFGDVLYQCNRPIIPFFNG